MIDIDVDYKKLLSECNDSEKLVEIYYLYLITTGITVHESLALDETIFNFKKLYEENCKTKIKLPTIELYDIYRQVFVMLYKHRDQLDDTDWEDDYSEEYLKIDIGLKE